MNNNNKQTLKIKPIASVTGVVNKKPSIFNQQDDDDDDEGDEKGTEKDTDSGFKPNTGIYSMKSYTFAVKAKDVKSASLEQHRTI